jgi:hypothetical protein
MVTSLISAVISPPIAANLGRHGPAEFVTTSACLTPVFRSGFSEDW